MNEGELVEGLVHRGWRHAASFDAARLVAALPPRYGPVPDELLRLLVAAGGLFSPDETVWFLGADDFMGRSDSAFAWNAWELMSLDAARGDQAWTDAISDFWGKHLPFVLSVRDGYAYLALSIESGAVSIGREPGFEECDTVAPSLSAFLALLGDALLGTSGRSEVGQFLFGGGA